MSYSLNYSGSPIVRGAWSTVTGGDRKSYIYRVKDLLTYLRQKFGKADKTVKNPKPTDFAGLKGILASKSTGTTPVGTQHYGTEAYALTIVIFLSPKVRRYGC